MQKNWRIPIPVCGITDGIMTLLLLTINVVCRDGLITPTGETTNFGDVENGWVAMTLANTLHLMPDHMKEKIQLKSMFY